jgi:hypothetical protein
LIKGYLLAKASGFIDLTKKPLLARALLTNGKVLAAAGLTAVP